MGLGAMSDRDQWRLRQRCAVTRKMWKTIFRAYARRSPKERMRCLQELVDLCPRLAPVVADARYGWGKWAAWCVLFIRQRRRLYITAATLAQLREADWGCRRRRHRKTSEADMTLEELSDDELKALPETVELDSDACVAALDYLRARQVQQAHASRGP